MNSYITSKLKLEVLYASLRKFYEASKVTLLVAFALMIGDIIANLRGLQFWVFEDFMI